jgi:hypothetical protein
MKLSRNIIGVNVGLLLALALVSGCNTGTTPSASTETKAPAAPTVVKGTIADWKIAKGYENATALPLSVAKDSGTMKVTWSSSKDFRSCELYALLPTKLSDGSVVDYGAYDGIQFKVKLPASSNFLLLLRNPDGGTTMKIWEDYVYRGTDDKASTVWVTVKKPFSAAVDTGWGPAPTPSTLKGWLTADKATQKQVNLNPVLNVGGGAALDTDIVMYVDDVGFYKAGTKGDGSDDAFTPIWDFE